MADIWVETFEPSKHAAASEPSPTSRRVNLGRALFAEGASLFRLALTANFRVGSYTVHYPAVSATFAVLGLLLTTRRPEHRVSWLMALTGLWGSLGAVMFAYAYTAVTAEPGSLPGGMVAAWFDN